MSVSFWFSFITRSKLNSLHFLSNHCLFASSTSGVSFYLQPVNPAKALHLSRSCQHAQGRELEEGLRGWTHVEKAFDLFLRVALLKAVTKSAVDTLQVFNNSRKSSASNNDHWITKRSMVIPHDVPWTTALIFFFILLHHLYLSPTLSQ